MDFISPLEKCNTESMEKILSSMEEILKKKFDRHKYFTENG